MTINLAQNTVDEDQDLSLSGISVTDNDDGTSVDCKFGYEDGQLPAGNSGIGASPLYPNYYVGNSLIPTKGEPPYVYDDNQSKNYFGSIYSDIIRSLV